MRHAIGSLFILADLSRDARETSQKVKLGSCFSMINTKARHRSFCLEIVKSAMANMFRFMCYSLDLNSFVRPDVLFHQNAKGERKRKIPVTLYQDL